MAKARLSIYSALAANLLIAVTKFIAGAFTNSSSMISEGIHSVVDSINQVLLLYGLKRSRKPPDQYHPFGYGKEIYFWSFIVSILIFGLGGGVSIFQGISHIRQQQPLHNPTWNYVVLGLSIIFEGISFLIASKEFNKARGELSWWKAITTSKDPSSFLVLFEDGAAVVGLSFVLVLMICNHAFGMPYLDGIASIIVGLLLVTVSLILARESRSLLMGEGISEKTRQRIKELAAEDPAVLKVLNILSTYQSPEEVILMLIVALQEDLTTEEITEAIDRVRDKIKKEFTLVHFVIIQPQALS